MLQTHTCTDTDTETHRDTHTETHTHRHRHTQTHTHRHTDTQTHKQVVRSRDALGSTHLHDANVKLEASLLCALFNELRSE